MGEAIICRRGGSSGKASLNIFTQLNEPKIKDGIWIQTNEKFKSIYQDTNVWLAKSWLTDYVPELPIKRSLYSIFEHNNKIYLLGGRSTDSPTYVSEIHALDLETLTWSVVGATTTFENRVAVKFNENYVYFLGRIGSSPTHFFRFNLETNGFDFTSSDGPRTTSCHIGAFKYGNEIFGVLGNSTGSSTYILAYNPANDTWREVAAKTFSGRTDSSRACLVGTKIYLIGGELTNTEVFDISTGTWRSEPAPPTVQRDIGLVVIDDKIHCLGGMGSNAYYVYDTINQTWSAEPPMSGTRYNFTPIFAKRKIFCLGGHSKSLTILATADVFSFDAKQYNEKELVIQVLPEYQVSLNQHATQIFNSRIPFQNGRVPYYFNDVWLYVNGDLQEYPTYVGDGTKWIKIKN